MNKQAKPIHVQLRIIGVTGKVDGVMEMVIGMFMMTGVVLQLDKGKTVLEGGDTAIYLDIDMLPPPLGNLGEGDIPLYTGDNP